MPSHKQVAPSTSPDLLTLAISFSHLPFLYSIVSPSHSLSLLRDKDCLRWFRNSLLLESFFLFNMKQVSGTVSYTNNGCEEMYNNYTSNNGNNGNNIIKQYLEYGIRNMWFLCITVQKEQFLFIPCHFLLDNEAKLKGGFRITLNKWPDAFQVQWQ